MTPSRTCVRKARTGSPAAWRGPGAEGVVLGCTELPLLIRPSDVSVRVFDTTVIHVAEAAAFALSGEG